jgi:ADP-sugar diphosphatase
MEQQIQHFYKGIPIIGLTPAIYEQIPLILKAPKFKNWFEKLDNHALDLQSITITDVDWFCAPTAIAPEKLGFLKLTAKVFDRKTEKPIPGIAFIRGGAVAVLIRVVVDSTAHFIMCRQLRFPVGGYTLEAPTGMMDASADISGVMIKEIAEETGLVVPNAAELIDLGRFIPSAGGSDESIHLFAWNTELSKEKFDEITRKIHGATEENETIYLHIFEDNASFPQKLQEIGDPKMETAYWRWKSFIDFLNR